MGGNSGGGSGFLHSDGTLFSRSTVLQLGNQVQEPYDEEDLQVLWHNAEVHPDQQSSLE